MATPSCSFDCLATPGKYKPDSDITGAGVVISYVATSALGILTIIVYYITTFDPSDDPFRDASKDGTEPRRPNAWDEILLRGLRFVPSYLSRRLIGSRSIMTDKFKSQFEKVLVKNIVLIGDLQVVTGFAILVSGYIQLQCGLESLKWRIILDLAWFSCLTHLTCLTMLRCHLHRHHIERVWRLSAMGALVVLQATGRLLTSNMVWGMEGNEARPALCLIYQAPESWTEPDLDNGDRNGLKIAYVASPILSALFLVGAFVSQIVRLHKSLSTLGERATQWLDRQTRRFLWKCFRALCVNGDTSNPMRVLIYRPIFSLVLLIRFALILSTSVATEVGWTILAFIWGIVSLYSDLSSKFEHLSFGRQSWTFGQVVAVLTLLAPIISAFGAWKEVIQKRRKGPEALRVVLKSHSSPELLPSIAASTAVKDFERPDTDWNACSGPFATTAISIYWFCLATAILSYVNLGVDDEYTGRNLSSVIWALMSALPVVPWLLYSIIACCIYIQQAVSGGLSWLRRVLQACICFYYMILLILLLLGIGDSAFGFTSISLPILAPLIQLVMRLYNRRRN